MARGDFPYGEAAYGESATSVVSTTLGLAVAVAVGFSPTPAGDAYTVQSSLASAVAYAPNPAVSDEAIISSTLARAVAVGFTPTLSGVTLTFRLAQSIAAPLTSTPYEVISGGTDSTNAGDGRSRDGISSGTTTYPVEPVPAGLTLGQKVDKAIAYPDPVMVNGRPT